MPKSALDSSSFVLLLPVQGIEHGGDDVAVGVLTEGFLGDDKFIRGVILNDLPEAAKDADVVVEIILDGIHDSLGLIGQALAGINAVEVAADVVHRAANAGGFAEISLLIAGLLRDLDVEQEVLKEIAVDEPVRPLIIEGVLLSKLGIAQHDRLILVDMMAVQPLRRAGNELVLLCAAGILEVVVLGRTIFIQ